MAYQKDCRNQGCFTVFSMSPLLLLVSQKLLLEGLHRLPGILAQSDDL